MNYCSSVAERAIEAVNRLLIAAMTSAWTSTLNHQHVVTFSEEIDDAREVCSRENSAAADCVRSQN
ncbi:hypothetical protein AYJ54_43720 [Bradyrhizobium centrolobii]|uniref:Uncharacterized protein n=1 Tax=Bradyrhizobium centrolobii TaxID=1505087 RepID=A0A176Z074_9BRAD|nr:hypothetical protein [Bradyrhizobium centrolobii]OAF13632.1 hypothetical protein AYJ54_43720 [Bradyrhizobium centrolobii]